MCGRMVLSVCLVVLTCLAGTQAQDVDPGLKFRVSQEGLNYGKEYTCYIIILLVYVRDIQKVRSGTLERE